MLTYRDFKALSLLPSTGWTVNNSLPSVDYWIRSLEQLVKKVVKLIAELLASDSAGNGRRNHALRYH